jgi:hypothetical protein
MSVFSDRVSFFEDGVEVVENPPSDNCGICRVALDGSPEEPYEYNGVVYTAEIEEGAPKFDNTVIKIKLCGMHMFHRGCLEFHFLSLPGNGVMEGYCPLDRRLLYKITLEDVVQQRLHLFLWKIGKLQIEGWQELKAKQDHCKPLWLEHLKKMDLMFADCRSGKRDLTSVLQELRSPQCGCFEYDHRWTIQLDIAEKLLVNGRTQESVIKMLTRNRKREFIVQDARPNVVSKLAALEPHPKDDLEQIIKLAIRYIRQFDPLAMSQAWSRVHDPIQLEKEYSGLMDGLTSHPEDDWECLKYIDSLTRTGVSLQGGKWIQLGGCSE